MQVLASSAASSGSYDKNTCMEKKLRQKLAGARQLSCELGHYCKKAHGGSDECKAQGRR